jgi:PGF-CTERM protein
MERKTIALIAVLGLALCAGCLDMTMTVDVAEDGDIDSMEVDMQMNEMLYSQLNASAQEEGYESVAAQFEADLVEGVDEESYGSVSSSSEVMDDGDRRLTVTVEDLDPSTMDNITTEVADGTVSYEDRQPTPSDQAGTTGQPSQGNTSMGGSSGNTTGGSQFEDQMERFEDQITMEYVVEMPGPITDTNAHNVSADNTTATWDLMEMDNESTIYAESQLPNEGGGDSTPGFGVAVALVAVAMAVALAHRRAD